MEFEIGCLDSMAIVYDTLKGVREFIVTDAIRSSEEKTRASKSG